MTLVPPDLLAAEAAVRVDLKSLATALVFAFAAGGAPEHFDDAVAAARLPPTSWEKADFARDVYLDELVARCMPVRIGGAVHRANARYVARVLGEPPRDDDDLRLRRAVLTELAGSPERRAELEKVYLAIARLRAILCTGRTLSARGRRVEVLRATREAFELLAWSFDGATSALGRLRAFGAEVVASPGHVRLVQLLDHDEHHGSLDLRVRVGADGEVRAMEIVGVRENSSNPFHVGVLRRFFARLLLFFRGWRTTRDEVAERLLSEVFAGVEEPLSLLFQLMGDIEPYLASLGLRDRAGAEGLAMALPEVAAPGDGMLLEGLFNPLLLAAGVHPVACTVRAAPGAVVVVTGPNSGGKTRLLQAIAIAQTFAAAGLFVPVSGGRLPRAPGLFASLYEEPRPDAPEGHLGMELLRIRRLFDRLDAGSVVVVDELCSGTNPSEGEEIARLVVSLLPDLGVQAFVTTHLLQFAARLAHERPIAGLDFLQVELDADERPTYRFVPGVAKTSLAQKTAARLGVTREELLQRIAARKHALLGPAPDSDDPGSPVPPSGEDATGRASGEPPSGGVGGPSGESGRPVQHVDRQDERRRPSG
jgi:DNA mismatch repair protein MutS2